MPWQINTLAKYIAPKHVYGSWWCNYYCNKGSHAGPMSSQFIFKSMVHCLKRFFFNFNFQMSFWTLKNLRTWPATFKVVRVESRTSRPDGGNRPDRWSGLNGPPRPCQSRTRSSSRRPSRSSLTRKESLWRPEKMWQDGFNPGKCTYHIFWSNYVKTKITDLNRWNFVDLQINVGRICTLLIIGISPT